MAKWINVKDELPEIGKRVLVCGVAIENRDYRTCAISNRVKYEIFGQPVERWRSPWDYFHAEYEITHWAELPELPKEDEDGEAD